MGEDNGFYIKAKIRGSHNLFLILKYRRPQLTRGLYACTKCVILIIRLIKESVFISKNNSQILFCSDALLVGIWQQSTPRDDLLQDYKPQEVSGM